MSATLAEQIATKEAELAQARQAIAANFDRFAGTSRLRGKVHKIRGDAQLRVGAQLGETVRRLERELASLRSRAERPATPPLDLTKLPEAKFIRTKARGWCEVVKVNGASVKVLTAPGWDDLIKISKIVEIR